eukprot:Gb_38434 [translate_table: standard]
MNGLELGEVSWQGDEMKRRSLVKLQKLWIFVGISLPAQGQQFALEIGIGSYDLVGGEMHQDFAFGGRDFDSVDRLRHGVGDQSGHPSTRVGEGSAREAERQEGGRETRVRIATAPRRRRRRGASFRTRSWWQRGIESDPGCVLNRESSNQKKEEDKWKKEGDVGKKKMNLKQPRKEKEGRRGKGGMAKACKWSDGTGGFPCNCWESDGIADGDSDTAVGRRILPAACLPLANRHAHSFMTIILTPPLFLLLAQHIPPMMAYERKESFQCENHGLLFPSLKLKSPPLQEWGSTVVITFDKNT